MRRVKPSPPPACCWAGNYGGRTALFVRLEREGHVFIFVARRATSEDCARDPRIGWGDWCRTLERVEVYRVARRGSERFLGYAEGEQFARLAACFPAVFDKAKSVGGAPAWVVMSDEEMRASSTPWTRRTACTVG